MLVSGCHLIDVQAGDCGHSKVIVTVVVIGWEAAAKLPQSWRQICMFSTRICRFHHSNDGCVDFLTNRFI